MQVRCAIAALHVRYGLLANLAAGGRPGATGMQLHGQAKDFGFDLTLEYGKGPVWHCDDGQHPRTPSTMAGYG